MVTCNRHDLWRFNGVLWRLFTSKGGILTMSEKTKDILAGVFFVLLAVEIMFFGFFVL
jgi:hypothetical protein